MDILSDERRGSSEKIRLVSYDRLLQCCAKDSGVTIALVETRQCVQLKQLFQHIGLILEIFISNPTLH